MPALTRTTASRENAGCRERKTPMEPTLSHSGRQHEAPGLYVVATLLEAALPKPFNSALLIDPRGETVLHHRKVHICDFDAPELGCARGHEFRPVDIQTWLGPVRVGMMICMDREFPEAARRLSRAGAELALVPNCCALARDAVVAEVRIAQARGRAFEMIRGIAVANDPAPRADGHSFATDPTGKVIAMANSLGLTTARFDLELIRRMRKEDRFRWCLR
jgi:predicted amidohydrolase